MLYPTITIMIITIIMIIMIIVIIIIINDTYKWLNTVK